MSKVTTYITYITVEIGDKGYSYPQDLPLPRVGEFISMEKSPICEIVDILYQISDTFRMITIKTK